MGDKKVEKKPEPVVQTPKKPVTLTLDAVITPHDVVGKAVAIVTAIPSGEFMEDEVLRRELNVSSDRWRQMRGSTRLGGYSHMMPDRKLLWGNKQSVHRLQEKMKEVV